MNHIGVNGLLMAANLRWRFDTVRLDGDQNGKLLETFVFAQLIAQIDLAYKPLLSTTTPGYR
jgi:hypothetical protein